MDRNTVYGLIVIGAILLGFTWYNSNQAEQFKREQAVRDSIALASQPPVENLPHNVQPTVQGELGQGTAGTATPTSQISPDSIRVLQYGSMLSQARTGQEQTYTMENDHLKVTVSNLGGRITGVELKDYNRYTGEPVQMYEPGSAEFGMEFFVLRDFNNLEVNTEDYYFTTSAPQYTVVNGAETLSMRLYVDEQSYVEYLYTLTQDDYMVDFKVNFVNMAAHLSNQSDMVINWGSIAPQNEKGFENENNYTTISYKFPNESGIDDLGMSTSSKSATINNRLQWVAFKQQFFSSVIIAENGFDNASLGYETFQPGTDQIKKYRASLSLPFSKQNEEYSFRYYFGPNKYSLLRQYDLGMEKLVPLGWGIIGWVNKLIIIPLFNFLGKFITSYGLIILLLTIFIKLITFPLTYKSYLSGAKMRLVKPELDAINEKYPRKEDAMKKQQAMMELYKRAGINPMGGCLPLLIQMPILIAMFRFFPASIELRGQQFLWAEDLSTYDSILDLPFKIPFYGDHVSLFTLLMAVAMHISTRISMAQQPSGPQMGGMKFMSLWLMPIMLLVWFNNYSSGLSYYYFLFSLITIVQTYAVRHFVNDDKLHAKMQANAAKKPKKKSKWQQRIEEMNRAQQQQARQQQGGKKKK